MDTKRAKEIVDSLGVIEVLYKGAPVWIEQIAGEYAGIKYLDKDHRNIVPVAELVEVE